MAYRMLRGLHSFTSVVQSQESSQDIGTVTGHTIGNLRAYSVLRMLHSLTYVMASQESGLHQR